VRKREGGGRVGSVVLSCLFWGFMAGRSLSFLQDDCELVISIIFRIIGVRYLDWIKGI
jgi:hypothetical protein